MSARAVGGEGRAPQETGQRAAGQRAAGEPAGGRDEDGAPRAGRGKPGTPATGRGERTRLRLLEAAEEVFAEQGFMRRR